MISIFHLPYLVKVCSVLIQEPPARQKISETFPTGITQYAYYTSPNLKKNHKELTDWLISVSNSCNYSPEELEEWGFCCLCSICMTSTGIRGVLRWDHWLLKPKRRNVLSAEVVLKTHVARPGLLIMSLKVVNAGKRCIQSFKKIIFFLQKERNGHSRQTRPSLWDLVVSTRCTSWLNKYLESTLSTKLHFLIARSQSWQRHSWDTYIINWYGIHWK